jgi:hypothetical protein
LSRDVLAFIDSNSQLSTTALSNGNISLAAQDDTALIRADAFGIAVAYAAATGPSLPRSPFRSALARRPMTSRGT